MRRPSLVSRALPTNSRGTFGPRPLFLPFPFPFPLAVLLPAFGLGTGAAGPSSSLRFVGLGFGAGLLGAEALAKGSKWKDTVVLERTFGSSFSKGISPDESLFKEVKVSAKCRNAARSARSTCVTVVLVYPGGASSWRCPIKSA